MELSGTIDCPMMADVQLPVTDTCFSLAMIGLIEHFAAFAPPVPISVTYRPWPTSIVGENGRASLVLFDVVLGLTRALL